MAVRSAAFASALAVLTPLGVACAQTATQVVRFEVTAVNQIGVYGSPAPLAITTATAGSSLTSVTSGGSSLAVTTNETNKKITAALDQPLPSGVTLEVTLAAPSGASSRDYVALSTAGADLVTGISATNATSLPLTYRLSATPQASIGVQTRTITYTIVSGT
jgi:hypothetical protein